MSNRFDRNRRFIAAIFLSAMFGMGRFSAREIFASLKMLMLAMLSKKGKASDELYEERMAICRDCALYYSPLRTCGSPLADNPELGCWCFLEEGKARVKKAKCWLRENTDIDYGWSDDGKIKSRDAAASTSP